MPEFFRKEDTSFKLAVWKITEDKDFFLSKLSLTDFDKEEMACLHAPNKLIQWLASRYLLKTLFNRPEILFLSKDDFGKPHVQNSPYKISLSHCRNFAAAIISENKCGIDVETVDSRINRISSKFLYEHEIRSGSGEQELTQKLTIYWSAKESLYKMYGEKGLTFKTQLIIDPFETDTTGILKAYVRLQKGNFPFKVYYRDFGDLILTYVNGSF